MSTIIVLGGCGVVGSVVSRTLAEDRSVSRVIIGDYEIEKAETFAASLKASSGDGKVSALHFDAFDKESIRNAVRQADLVVNCVGPFHSTVKNILPIVLEEKKHYLDICDDVDVTLEVLELDEEAKKAGTVCVLGLGNSPGVTNVLAKFAAEELFDSMDTVDIFHTHGGEPVEGPGVIGHRFHCMSIPIPMFLDGKLVHLNYFKEDGIALRQEFEFPLVGKTLLYPYPHPEQVTIPKYIDLKNVTNKGSVLPDEYYNMIRDVCAVGLADTTPVDVKGQKVIPREFSIAYIIRERERILRELNYGGQRGCLTVIVKGEKNGEFLEYRFHMASTSQALGEGTGIPAAVGALMIEDGSITKPGVNPPENCVDPKDFIVRTITTMTRDSEKKDKSFKGLIVEKIDEKGRKEEIDFASLVKG